MSKLIPLNEVEKATYEWQMTVPEFGEKGQEILKNSTVMISRCGGLGSVVAYELAAAGIGKMVIAHGGNIKHSDLNRQLLMTYDALGTPRIDSVEKRLKELNPRLEIVKIGENINEENVIELVEQSDIIVDCAPLFEERYLMNREAVNQNKPLVECAMYELQSQLTTIMPGKTPCLSCIYPDNPDGWKRQFPVFGAVSGSLGCMAAMEVIKVLAGFGEPLYSKLHTYDLRDMSTHTVKILKNEKCPVCGDK